MKIIIDKKIPYIKGVFESNAKVVYALASKIDAAMVKDADVLIVRTRTKCDADLLQGSSVKFIATATIGYDHIDTDFCDENGIVWTNAPGCNADAVVQYVFAAIYQLLGEKCLDMTLGVVGVGNVGSRVANFAEKLGMKVLRNDPPRAEIEGADSFVSMEEIQKQADIITFHTPLTREGAYPTFHLLNDDFINSLEKQPIIINAARGEVTDSEALLNAIDNDAISNLVLDCWENEPNINEELMAEADIATPHIAGYSMEGKANATAMAVQSVSEFFDLDLNDWRVELPENRNVKFSNKPLLEQIEYSYDIAEDDFKLRNNPSYFEYLRGKYDYRRQPICL